MNLSELKKQSAKRQADFEKVEKWLDAIGEKDPDCREAVMEQCRNDTDALAYYVSCHHTTVGE